MVIFLAIKDVGQITHFAEQRRISGVGNQPNMLGAFVVDYMFLFLGMFMVSIKKKFYWLALVPFLWGIRAVAFSFSRGAYIAFVLSLLVISFLKNKLFFIGVIILLVFIYMNTWILPNAVRERIEMTVSGKQVYGYGVEYEQSAAARVDAWKATLNLIRNKPLFGYGIGMVGVYLYYYAKFEIADVHNSFLLLAAEHGLVTLAIFLLCLITGIKNAWFVYRNSQDEILKGAAFGFLIGIIGLMSNCMFGSHMTTLWEIGYFWILLAIFCNEERELKNELAALQKA